MTPGQTFDLSKRVIHCLRVERSSALEKRLRVTEIAGVRASARDHDRIRHQVKMTLDQIAANLRQAVERADRRAIELTRPPRTKVPKEYRPRVFARPDEYGVGMPGGLFRQ